MAQTVAIEPTSPRPVQLLAQRVVMVVYPDANALDVSGPIQVFATAAERAEESGAPGGYELIIASRTGGPVRLSCGMEIITCPIEKLRIAGSDTVLVAGGNGSDAAAADDELVRWVAQAAQAAGRLGSICTGAFVLAAAGLLEGRRAVTHWAFCDQLRHVAPSALIEADAVFVEDRGLWTSAGVTAGLDMALAMVELDLGAAVARETARRLVFFMRRPGRQPQISAGLRAQMADQSRVQALAEWIAMHPRENLTSRALAARARMSLRTLFRAFRDELEMAPTEFVRHARIEVACRLMDRCDLQLSEIADRAGFASPEAMRRAFVNAFRTTPARYRAGIHPVAAGGRA